MRYLNLTSSSLPYSVPSKIDFNNPYSANLQDLGVQEYTPVKQADYLPLCYDFLEGYAKTLAERRDVDVAVKCEYLAMCTVCYEYTHSITASQYGTLRSLADDLPKMVLSRFIHCGDDNTHCLEKLYTYVYMPTFVSPSDWQELARIIDSPETDLQPEERLALSYILDQHSIEIENAVLAARGAMDSLQLNPERVNYVSYKSLLSGVMSVNKKVYQNSRSEREFLWYKIEVARDIGVLTPALAGELLDSFRK